MLIVKQVENEDAGTISEFLDKNGITYKRVLLYENEKLPRKFDDISSIVVLGGPMNVYEEEKYPFLKEEDLFIKNALRRKIPFLGICLGAQLLAKACGANVYKAANAEIGIFNVELCDGVDNNELGIFKTAPKIFPAVQWHGDTFDIPHGGRLLATSLLCKNQAFVLNENAYALQFHVEVTKEIINDWFEDVTGADDIFQRFNDIKEDYYTTADNIYSLFFGA